MNAPDSGNAVDPVPDIVVELTTPVTLLGSSGEREAENGSTGVKLVTIIFPRHRVTWLCVSASAGEIAAP
jgi:hypothetical protein